MLLFAVYGFLGLILAGYLIEIFRAKAHYCCMRPTFGAFNWREGDGMCVQTPDGIITMATMREFRQRVFDIEEKYSMETVNRD